MKASTQKNIWLLAAVAMMLITLLLIARGQNVTRQELANPLSSLDLAIGPWRAVGEDDLLNPETRALLKPQDYLLRRYVDPSGHRLSVFAAYFGLQEEGAMIHSPRHCLPGSGWQIQKRREVRVKGGGDEYTVNQLILVKRLTTLSVMYWYQGRGRVQANEYLDRVSLLWDGVTQKRSDGALVRVTAVLNPADKGVEQRQAAFCGELIPAMERLLPPLSGGLGGSEKQ